MDKVDYKAACNTIVSLQGELHFYAQRRAGLRGKSQEQRALDATYVLLEYLGNRIKEETIDDSKR